MTAPDRPAAMRTPLTAEHVALGAHFTDFGGWEMPLKYGSELAEHHAVRETAGIFDLSHMGEIRVEGRDAATFLNSVLAGDLAAVTVGRAKYSLVLHEDGGIIDDLISYRLAEHHFLVVPNAGNTAEVARIFQAHADQSRQAGADVTITDISHETSLIAVQGPEAEATLAALAADDNNSEAEQLVRDLKYFSAAQTTLHGAPLLLARTGYTGEDGFELYVPHHAAVQLWRTLLDVSARSSARAAGSGALRGLVPAGLAARDSLRLEVGLPLYGNELSRDTTPDEVGLGGVVSLTKPENFPGRAALEAAGDPARVLVGLQGLGRRAGRAGYDVWAHGETVGRITSGQPSPTLGTPIALALIDPVYRTTGTTLDIDVRGTMQPVEVVALPFYRRSTRDAARNTPSETATTPESSKESTS